MKGRLKLFIPLILFAVMGFFLFRGLSFNPQSMPSALIGQPFPEFALPSLSDPQQMITTDDLEGRVALVNIWATWCPACSHEHPFLNKLAAEQIVPIYGIDYKDERASALKWLANGGDPYQINIFDSEGKLGVDLGVFGAPETFVIDHLGVIRYRHVGIVDQRVWTNTLEPIVESLKLTAEQARLQGKSSSLVADRQE